MSDKNILMQEIESIVGEVQELLKKSGMPLHKDGPEDEMTPPGGDMGGAPEAPAPEAPAPDAIGDQAAAPMEGEGAPAPEAGLEGAATEGEGDLAAEAKGLSDEELDNLLQVLMAEKEGRKAPDQAAAPMEAPAPQAPAPAEKSMKEEYAKLGKSIEAIVGSMEALSKKVDSLSAKPAPQAPKVTAKAPVANPQDVQVLHKSAPVMKRLSKSETVDFLENQLRKGNKMINRDVMHDVVLTKTDEELHAVQDGLAKKGIELPKL